MKPLVPLAIVAALAACNRQVDAPWVTMPDLATHSARWFPISLGAVHGPAPGQALGTCNSCHADRSSGVTPPPPSASFRTFTCTGCHVEIRPGVFHDDVAALAGGIARHAGLAGFDPALVLTFDRSCRTCHPTGLAVNHALVFPLPHRDAAGTAVAACWDCHVSTDRKVLGCAACHPHDQPATAAAHAAVPDFVAGTGTAASAACLRCHGDGVVPVRVASHAAFPIGGTSFHAGAAGGACLACHPGQRAAPKAFAADFSTVTCVGCHVATPAGFHDDPTALASYHATMGVTGFDPAPARCLSCHPNGTGGAPPYHDQLFPIAAGTRHFGIACGACHGAVRTDVAGMKCASCHADASRSPSFPTTHPAVNGVAVLVELTAPPATCTPAAYTPTSADCLACHAQAIDYGQLSTTHPQGDTGFGKSRHKAAGCTTCHVVTKQVTATVTPPATPPSGYPAIDFRTFVGTGGAPTSPSQSAQGCRTCHAYGCD
jgi:hypothetical protein